jgi:hypothetical protein
MAKRQPSSKETKAYTASVASNKAFAAAAATLDSDYSTCHVSLHGCHFTPSSTSHIAHKAVFDQEFVPHTPGTVLDSGAQGNILEGALGSGTGIQLTGITGAKTEAETADAVSSLIAADGSRHAILIRGKNFVAARATDNILSLAVLLQAGYKVNFRVGTDLLTQLMTVTSTRQLVSASLSFSQAISGGFQCGAHHDDVRVLPVCLVIKIHTLHFYMPMTTSLAHALQVKVSPFELSVADQLRL